MKKFMFSAVALVAFSFAGMASNGEVEKMEEKKIIEKDIFLKSDSCCLVHGLAYDLAISEGADSGTAGLVADIAYNNCLKTSSKSVSID